MDKWITYDSAGLCGCTRVLAANEPEPFQCDHGGMFIRRKPAPLQQALSQLRALEAAGEDPRNANQGWDVTPEQAGALLAHLDDVEQKRAEAVAALNRYGDHEPGCDMRHWDAARHTGCTCGFQEASDGK